MEILASGTPRDFMTNVSRVGYTSNTSKLLTNESVFTQDVSFMNKTLENSGNNVVQSSVDSVQPCSNLTLEETAEDDVGNERKLPFIVIRFFISIVTSNVKS